MSSSSRVLRHPRAERDIDEQVGHYLLVEGAPAAAARFVDAIEHALELLVRYPDAGAPCGTITSSIPELRRWPVPGFDNHLIFYRANKHGIEVVRVLHGARNLEQLFETEGDGS